MRSDRHVIYQLLAAGRINPQQAERLLWAASGDTRLIAGILALALALVALLGAGSGPSSIHTAFVNACSMLRHTAAVIAYSLGATL